MCLQLLFEGINTFVGLKPVEYNLFGAVFGDSVVVDRNRRRRSRHGNAHKARNSRIPAGAWQADLGIVSSLGLQLALIVGDEEIRPVGTAGELVLPIEAVAGIEDLEHFGVERCVLHLLPASQVHR